MTWGRRGRFRGTTCSEIAEEGRRRGCVLASGDDDVVADGDGGEVRERTRQLPDLAGRSCFRVDRDDAVRRGVDRRSSTTDQVHGVAEFSRSTVGCPDWEPADCRDLAVAGSNRAIASVALVGVDPPTMITWPPAAATAA